MKMTTSKSRLSWIIATALLAVPTVCEGFVAPSTSAIATFNRNFSVKSTSADLISDAANFMPANDLSNDVANMISSSLMVAETEAWVQPMSLVLGPVLSFLSIGMVCAFSLANLLNLHHYPLN